MKIFETTGERSCTGVDRPVFLARLSTGDLGPHVHFEGSLRYMPLDAARKLARAILAIPRPCDAPPEELP